jgi:ubiquinone/menaquinone biosynthesis C-methylase UbiE
MPPDEQAAPVLTDVDWLDTHFTACQPEYEACLRSIGMQPGWRVLDAGCGSGSFLPVLAELVGSTGQITAIDLLPDNVAVVQRRLADWTLPCPVDVQEGGVLALPFANATFDAVWCSNTTQYFSDEDLVIVLRELRRVVRPGGLVAVKDVDMQLVRIAPAIPFLVAHLAEVSQFAEHGAVQSRGSLRGRLLRRWLERVGLENVWQRTTLIERWAPLRPVERRLWEEWLAFLASLAEERGVPDQDRSAWHVLRDPTSPEHPLNAPDFYACEGQAVAVGYVPKSDPSADTGWQS